MDREKQKLPPLLLSLLICDIALFIFAASAFGVLLIAYQWDLQPVSSLLLVCIILILVSTVIVIKNIQDTKKLMRRVVEIVSQNPEWNYEGKTLGISFLLEIIDELSKKSEIRSKYQVLQRQASLNVMQNSINPHFLFNILDSIRGTAIMENAIDTAKNIEQVAVFFRYRIYNTNNIISLEDELFNVKTYINILKFRFGDRFFLETIIEDDEKQILTCRIPKLTLQPLVENAVTHGLESMEEGGKIVIRIWRTDSRVDISIKDNGVGMPLAVVQKLNRAFARSGPGYIVEEQNTSGKSSGVALQNVNNRIKLLYGCEYGLHIASTEGYGTEVSITLPFNND